MAPAILPDLVLAIGLLSFFAAVGMPLGLHTVVLAHAVFGTAFVMAVVRARLVQLDRRWRRRPGPGRRLVHDVHCASRCRPSPRPWLAGALLAFTLSLDEFVIAFFTNGPTSPTLPIEIYSMVRFGVTPEINALATMLLLVSVDRGGGVAWRPDERRSPMTEPS